MVNNVWKGNKQKIVTIVVVVTLFLITFALLANTGIKLYDTKFANEVLEEQKEKLNKKLKVSELKEQEAVERADSIITYYTKELGRLKRSNARDIENIEKSYDKKISSYDTIAFVSAYELLADIRYDHN
jgi:hypothetical protein